MSIMLTRPGEIVRKGEIEKCKCVSQFFQIQQNYSKNFRCVYVCMTLCGRHFFGSMNFCQNPSIVFTSQPLSSNRQQQAYLMNMFHHSLYSQYNQGCLNKEKSLKIKNIPLLFFVAMAKKYVRERFYDLDNGNMLHIQIENSLFIES